MTVLFKLWNFFSPYQPQIIAFILTSTSAFITYILRAKIKIIWGLANNSFHSVPVGDDKHANVYCEKIYVQNLGRKPACDVDIVLDSTPTTFTIFPIRKNETQFIADGKLNIRISYITPKELIILDTININAKNSYSEICCMSGS
jgi:hypothetical protein